MLQFMNEISAQMSGTTVVHKLNQGFIPSLLYREDIKWWGGFLGYLFGQAKAYRTSKNTIFSILVIFLIAQHVSLYTIKSEVFWFKL